MLAPGCARALYSTSAELEKIILLLLLLLLLSSLSISS